MMRHQKDFIPISSTLKVFEYLLDNFEQILIQPAPKHQSSIPHSG